MPYLGRSPGSGVRSRFIYAATSGQTSFSGNDSNSVSLAYEDTLYMDVYQNGVLLKPVTDYAATTGTSVVLTTGATTDDVVEMIVYDTFAVADTVSASNGGTFAGDVAFTANANFGDNNKAQFGAGSDLEIFHDGSNSNISDVGTGQLVLRTDGTQVAINKGSSENMAKFIVDGAVELYHDNSKKFATASTGVDITGGFTATDECKITTTGSEELNLELISTNADANKGPVISFHRNSSSPANDDILAELNFNGENSAGEKIDYVDIFAQAHNVGDGSEEGGFNIRSMVGGTLRNRMTMFGSTTKFNDNAQDIDFVVESSNETECFKVDAGQDRVNITGNNSSTGALIVHNDGNNNNRIGLTILAGKDDASGTNFAVVFQDGDGSSQGNISFSSGTVTYGAFTAHHPCIIPDSDNTADSQDAAYPYGTLLETTSLAYSQKNGADTERGLRYNVRKTQAANSRAVLGAYGGCMNGGPDNETNAHLALVLGDGHILCNNSGGNIEVGDGICSSAAEGIGQKATASPSMIIGIAQEAVTFANNTETKLVAVQYGLQQFTPWS